MNKSSSALDRLFNVTESDDARYNKNKSSYTFDEVLASANDDDDDLLGMMSAESKSALLSRIMPEEEASPDDVEEISVEIPEEIPAESTPEASEIYMEETDIEIDRPADKPITDDEQLNDADDINEEIVAEQPVKRKRRKRRVQHLENESAEIVKKETSMEKQNVTNSILDILSMDLIESLLAENYTFHGFSVEDTKLIIEYMKNQLTK